MEPAVVEHTIGSYGWCFAGVMLQDSTEGHVAGQGHVAGLHSCDCIAHVPPSSFLLQEFKDTGCSESKCKGSFMQLKPKRPFGTLRPKEEVLPFAVDFIKQYYDSKKV